MEFFSARPNLYRAFLGVIATLLLAIAGFSFIRYGSVTNDENWFRQPPSEVYVTAPIPATLVEAPGVPDSIPVGDLLVRIAEKGTHRSLDDLRKHLAGVPADSMIEMWTYRTTEAKLYFYGVRAGTLTDSVMRETGPAAAVFYVFPGGASDRAGMKAGDLILRINDQSFRSIFQADSILRTAQAGKILDYEVLRNNEFRILHVTLAPFGFSVGFLVMFFTGIAYIAMGLFLGMKRPAVRPARLLGLGFLLIGFAVSVVLIQRDLDSPGFVTARTIVMAFSMHLGVAVLLHASYYFPREYPELIGKPWIRWLGYGLALALPLIAMLANIYILTGIVGLLVYSVVVSWVMQKHLSTEARRMWSPLVRGTVVGGILSMAILGYAALVVRFSGDLVIGYAGVGLLLIPLSYLYVIGRYNILELDLRVRRNSQYLVAAMIWRLGSFTLFVFLLLQLASWSVELPGVRFTGLSLEIMEQPVQGAEQLVLGKTVAIFIALAMTLVFWWVGRKGLELLARKFHRAKYDYRRAAAELGRVMATRLTMEALAQGIVQALGELMAVKRVGVLFFRDQTTCCCQEAFGFDGSVWRELCLGVHEELAGALRGLRNARSIEDLPEDIKRELKMLEFHLIVPIHSNSRLIGAILLGEKESESAFHQEDFEFLAAASMQASVAIENAFLYEELAVQERLKHELAIARRIQLESLPQRTPQVASLDIAGSSLPALEVGGDYFDYLNGIGQQLTVIVGDVSGKGTSAALYMSKVQGILRSLHGFGLGPKELLVRANQLLYGDIERKSFITALGAAFDTPARTVIVARAGHLPLYRYRAATGEIEKITPRGLGLALNEGAVFAEELEEVHTSYAPGDILLFVTDGVTEARRSNGEQFGEAGVEQVLRDCGRENAATIRDTLLSRVKTFAGEEQQHDDQTVVVVKALG